MSQSEKREIKLAMLFMVHEKNIDLSCFCDLANEAFGPEYVRNEGNNSVEPLTWQRKPSLLHVKGTGELLARLTQQQWRRNSYTSLELSKLLYCGVH